MNIFFKALFVFSFLFKVFSLQAMEAAKIAFLLKIEVHNATTQDVTINPAQGPSWFYWQRDEPVTITWGKKKDFLVKWVQECFHFELIKKPDIFLKGNWGAPDEKKGILLERVCEGLKPKELRAYYADHSYTSFDLKYGVPASLVLVLAEKVENEKPQFIVSCDWESQSTKKR